jgi:hypothetical protein
MHEVYQKKNTFLPDFVFLLYIFLLFLIQMLEYPLLLHHDNILNILFGMTC